MKKWPLSVGLFLSVGSFHRLVETYFVGRLLKLEGSALVLQDEIVTRNVISGQLTAG